MNLVLGTCAGYSPGKIRHFVESLRCWFNGKAVLVTANLPPETKGILKKYDIQEHEIHVEPPLFNIQVSRYRAYRDVLKSLKNIERAFLVDVRDVFFQADPFLMLPEAPLVAYLEEQTIGNCKINSAWITHLYGARRLADLGARSISCSGTTAGTRAGLLRYLDLMCREIDAARSSPIRLAGLGARAISLAGATGGKWPGLPRYINLMGREIYPRISGRLPLGADQGIHNHLVHGELSETILIPNRIGAVQTMHYQKTFLFDRLGRLLNDDGSVCPILHQIDRHPQFFSLWGIRQGMFNS